MSEQNFPHLNNSNNDIALTEGDKSYSYAEVNQAIDRFATGLLKCSDD